MHNEDTHSDFTAPEIEEIADLLPGYDILSLIAVGGMGAVYHARQKSLDREVAIKILPKQMSADDEFRASFEREAKSMAKFNHPNLIGIYDFGEEAGYLYIIMELVHGKSLYYSAYQKTIDPDEAARLMIGVCEGLGAAHANGILHRDIKPSNILLDASASPKIGDFGISRAAGDFESDTCYGTPGYTAPEVVHNVRAIDESTDLYAVGVMLYELLTGHVPEGSYTPASAAVGCDPRFDRIIAKATNPDPALRYRKAEEMADDLRQIREARVQTGPVLVPSAATGPVPHRTHAVPIASAQQSSSTGRNVAIIIFLLVAIFASWKGYKSVKASNEKKQAKADVEKAEALAKQKAEREKRAKAKEAARQAAAKQREITPAVKKETPMESLERLRHRLVNGSRVELPVGTRKRSGRARFLIEKPMTWFQAQQFCEEYGGHLPVFPDPAALARFCNKLEPGRRVWLGAGTNGDGWSWIDGTPWDQEIRKTSKSAYVTADDTGILAPRPASEKCAFYIEWNMDGSNPGSLEAQIERMAATGDDTEFPAGTVRHEGHHYLLISREISWTEARKLAATAGGMLAVPSDKIENEWLLGRIKTTLPEGKLCWLGGHRDAGELWKWLDGEPWKFATWAENQPDVSSSEAAALTGTTGQTWQDLEPSETAHALLIEWVSGAKKTKPTAPKQVVTSGVEKKRAVCVRVLADIDAKYAKLYKRNTKSYEREIEAYSRRLPRRERGNMSAAILMMTQGYVGDMIPENMPHEGLSRALVDILQDALDSQKKIQAKYLVEVEQLRAKYCASLQENVKALEARGLTTMKRKTEAEIAACGQDAKTFINHTTGKHYAEAIATGLTKKSDRSRWTAVASSAEGVEGVERVLDGDPNTIWHSVWNTSEVNHLPHTLDISFGEKLAFSGLVLTPRRANPQNGFNGVIKGYEIYIKTDAGNWKKIKTGELPRNNETQHVRFGKVVSTTAVRIKSLSSHAGMWTSLAEFDLIR